MQLDEEKHVTDIIFYKYKSYLHEPSSYLIDVTNFVSESYF